LFSVLEGARGERKRVREKETTVPNQRYSPECPWVFALVVKKFTFSGQYFLFVAMVWTRVYSFV
jgi:hypothetical protein